jgi:hypothetical protein
MQIEIGCRPPEVTSRYIGYHRYNLDTYKAIWLYLKWFYVAITFHDISNPQKRR